MPRVLNLVTGREHDVPAGHYSLSSADYEVLVERKAPAPEPAAAKPKAAPRARKSAK